VESKRTRVRRLIEQRREAREHRLRRHDTMLPELRATRRDRVTIWPLEATTRSVCVVAVSDGGDRREAGVDREGESVVMASSHGLVLGRLLINGWVGVGRSGWHCCDRGPRARASRGSVCPRAGRVRDRAGAALRHEASDRREAGLLAPPTRPAKNCHGGTGALPTRPGEFRPPLSDALTAERNGAPTRTIRARRVAPGRVVPR